MDLMSAVGSHGRYIIKQIEFKQPVTMAFPEIVVVFAVIAMCAAAPSDRELIMIIIITFDQHKTNASKYTLFMIIQKYLNSNQQFLDFSEMIDTEQRKLYTKSLYGCTLRIIKHSQDFINTTKMFINKRNNLPS